MKINSESDLKNQVRPLIFNPNKIEDLEQLKEIKSRYGISIVDEIESQIGELIKVKNPSKSFNSEELALDVKDFLKAKDISKYGNWIFYPWKNCLVHLLPEEDFIAVRTARNKYKITFEEQEFLSKKVIGIVGLSVGQSVALAIALERSCGEIRLADFDVLELSNMNRIRTGLPNLGLKKTTIAAREILELDPYLKVTIFDEGINEDNIDQFFLGVKPLDLVIDECDSLDIKVLIREKAKKFQIPVVMDTSDRGMLDIERFDLNPEREIFHGLIGSVDHNKLKILTNKEKIPFVLKITGVETLSPRMKASMLEINQSITSWPQLASAVFLGGALGAHAARNIFLDQSRESGRYFVDLDELLDKDTHTIEVSTELKETLASDNRLQQDFNHINNDLKSEYILSNSELETIIKKGSTAPSGGNCQPWQWIFDLNGVLHLYHDKIRSESLLDFKGTGSLIAFGAALENVRLWCCKNGIVHSIIPQISQFGQDKIASITFKEKVSNPIPDKYLYLESFIEDRLTNRLNQKRLPLPKNIISELTDLVDKSEFELKVFETDQEINAFSSVNGIMDWVRMINERGYEEFIKEIRWSSEEARSTKDGIDLTTFDFGPSDLAVLKLVGNKKAMKLIRNFKLGKGFTKISDKTFESASAVCLLTAKSFKPETYLEAGKILQRIWIHSNMQGISFQPITASLFMYHRYLKGDKTGFSDFESNLIEKNYTDFRKISGISDNEEEIFLFRLNLTKGEVVKSYRRDVGEILKRL